MLIKIPLARLGLGLAVLAGAAALIGASGTGLTVHDKAYYAGSDQLNFVRPGLVIQVTGAAISADGIATAQFKLTDPKGQPLDRLGVTTPGTMTTIAL